MIAPPDSPRAKPLRSSRWRPLPREQSTQAARWCLHEPNVELGMEQRIYTLLNEGAEGGKTAPLGFPRSLTLSIRGPVFPGGEFRRLTMGWQHTAPPGRDSVELPEYQPERRGDSQWAGCPHRPQGFCGLRLPEYQPLVASFRWEKRGF